MKLDSINCNHCGAPLTVAKSARYVTCKHCETQLAVRRTESAAFTEEVERLAETTDRISDQLAQISYDNAVERLDREWERERKQYMVRSKNGSEHIPTTTGAIATFIVGGFMVVMAFAASRVGGPMFGLFALLALGIALFAAATSFRKAQKYQEAESRYQRRRRELDVEQFRSEEESIS